MKNIIIFFLFMLFLLGFAYFLVGPQLIEVFLRKTASGRLIRDKINIGCTSNPNPLFTKDITDLGTIGLITPPGSIESWNGEKILKSHAYLIAKDSSPIYVPVDSKLTEGSFYIEEGMAQYLLIFEVSCEVYYKFDHVQEPVDKVKALFTGEARNDTRTSTLGEDVEFKAGELIGYTKGTLAAGSWDFGVYNRQNRNNFDELEGVSVSEMDYEAVCPFDYFSPQKAAAYKDFFGNIKTGEPVPELFCN